MIAVIVSGASGQLGKAILATLSFSDNFNVYSFDRGQLDITDNDKIRGILATLPQSSYWINCAAYTKVDEAETQTELAYRCNALGPSYIASACREAGVHLFDFSSDYVYHNTLRRPLMENDPTTPQGVYAKSKREGEMAIIQSGASYTILRTSWVFGPGGNNFVNTMLRLGSTRPEVKVVGDQTGAPTYTHDIAATIRELIQIDRQGRRSEIQGIFNYSNAGMVTWDDFARKIFSLAGLHCTVKTISTEEYGAPAPRPPFSVLNCEKISSLLEHPIPHWEDALERYLNTQSSAL